MVNQVLHHLPDAPHDRRTLLRRRCSGEFVRVLRPGGAAIINTCSHDQLRRGWWYAALIPEAVEAMCRRHADTTVLIGLLAEAGLTPAGRFVPSDALIQGDAYFDGRGPLDPAWRRAIRCGRWSPKRNSSARSTGFVRSTKPERSTHSSPSMTACDPSIGQIGFHCAVREPAPRASERRPYAQTDIS